MASLELMLENRWFLPGETIRGTLDVRVDEQLKHRGIFVELLGVEETKIVRSTGKSVITYRESNIMARHLKVLCGEDVLVPPGEKFSFELRIPENALPTYSGSSAKVLWRVEAKVDVPLGLDLKAERMLFVGRVADERSLSPARIEFSEEDVAGCLELPRRCISPGEDFEFNLRLDRVEKVRSVRLELWSYEVARARTLLGDVRDRSRTFQASWLLLKAHQVGQGIRTFRVSVPRRVPLSYSGAWSSLTHELKLVFDKPLSFDYVIRVPVEVAFVPRKRRAMARSAEEKWKAMEKEILVKKYIELILSDGKPRDVVDITLELQMRYDLREEPSRVREICEELVERGTLEKVEEGVLLAKYRIAKKA